MTKAQQQFISRQDDVSHKIQDSRAFSVWYHNDDVQRIVWVLYQQALENQKNSKDLHEKFMPPYVFFDGIDSKPFADVMTVAKQRLLESDKKYLPIIFKPELGGAHYMAGILKKEKDNSVRFFLFNPLGYPDSSSKEIARKRLQLESYDAIGDMKLILSPHTVQDKQKDGGILVSCGPLSIEFIRYALNNPEWVEGLDEQFALPELLAKFISAEKSQYIDDVALIRKYHYDILSNISDKELEKEVVEDFYAKGNLYILEGLERIQVIKRLDNEDDYDTRSDDDDDQNELLSDSQEYELDIDEEQRLDPCDSPKASSHESVVSASTLQGVGFKQTAVQNTSPSKKGIEAVEKEIDRLNKMHGFFSDSAHKKAAAIKMALEQAKSSGNVLDVRKDLKVREALGEHRIWSFFGLWTAQSLINVNKSIEDEESLSMKMDLI